MKTAFFLSAILCSVMALPSATSHPGEQRFDPDRKPLMTGADQTGAYLPLLRGKRVGVLANQTSIIGQRPMVDSLLSLGVCIKMIFGPEHGFRSNASNGANVGDEVDAATGIPIISLYGKRKAPSPQEMDSIDVLIFDLQDVGCRFFTYINVLAEVMGACSDAGKELLILDRPDPNGYVDGPVLDMKLSSGIGKFPVPITHGMTIGEFAQMINGEGWLPGKKKCRLHIVPVKNYAHGMEYTLPVPPSPNLNTQQAVLLYPSLCWFEGTVISLGRGTQKPFTVLGNPGLSGYPFSFTPVSIPGMSETPLWQDQRCYGLDLGNYDTKSLHAAGRINLGWLKEMYAAAPHKEKFFDYHQSNQMGNFDKLAGTSALREQIIAGKSENEIRQSWKQGLDAYKKMRKKYTIYPD